MPDEEVTREAFVPPPFEARQYLLTLVLLGLGAWCLRDGWFNHDETMQKYRLFNRIGSVVFLAWGLVDGWRMRNREIAHARRRWEAERASGEASA
jgi:hypothetical protein